MKKHYWILMPPFLITFILLFIFLPNGVRYYSLSLIIVFWIVYYFWDYYAKKRTKMKKTDNLI